MICIYINCSIRHGDWVRIVLKTTPTSALLSYICMCKLIAKEFTYLSLFSFFFFLRVTLNLSLLWKLYRTAKYNSLCLFLFVCKCLELFVLFILVWPLNYSVTRFSLFSDTEFDQILQRQRCFRREELFCSCSCACACVGLLQKLL